MAKYRKKPVVIEAVQWTGKNFEELAELIGSLEEGRPERRAVYDELDMTLKIKTLEGNGQTLVITLSKVFPENFTLVNLTFSMLLTKLSMR